MTALDIVQLVLAGLGVFGAALFAPVGQSRVSSSRSRSRLDAATGSLATGARRLIPTGSGRSAFRHELPGCLEDIGRSLRSGRSVTQALSDASGRGDDQCRRQLAQVATAAERGASVEESLASWAQVAPTTDVHLAVAALTLGGRIGGSRARAVDQVATTLRDRLALADEVRAQSASARVSAMVMVAAPVVFAAFAGLIDPAVGVFLLTTPMGIACIAGAVLLDLAGAGWMQQILRNAS